MSVRIFIPTLDQRLGNVTLFYVEGGKRRKPPTPG